MTHLRRLEKDEFYVIKLNEKNKPSSYVKPVLDSDSAKTFLKEYKPNWPDATIVIAKVIHVESIGPAEEPKKCKNCKHWRLENPSKRKVMGCYLWSAFKHFGVHPIRGGREGTLIEFENLMAEHGPIEPFEGWVKGLAMGMVNNSIITKEGDICNFYQVKE